MSALALGMLLVILPVLPIWMRSVFRRSALLNDVMQSRVHWGFQVCLFFSVFLSFFLTYFTFVISYRYLVSYLTDLTLNSYFWDEPLTPRGFFAILILLVAPYLIFCKIGLVSIRDVHQLCKEQRDRLMKRKKTGWKGISG
jgi:hypothetical protein